MKNKQKNTLANFLFEAQVLKRLRRTGWQILGENEENVADHLYLTAVIVYILSTKIRVDREKVLLMALFHDFHETRTGDLDKISLRYLRRDSRKANQDIFARLPFGSDLVRILDEYEGKKTVEAKLVYEANVLALLMELKVLVDKGSKHAKEWLSANKERLRLKKAKELAEEIVSTDSQDFWQEIREKLHREFRE